jgi:hypothetical protein
MLLPRNKTLPRPFSRIKKMNERSTANRSDELLLIIKATVAAQSGALRRRKNRPGGFGLGRAFPAGIKLILNRFAAFRASPHG